MSEKKTDQAMRLFEAMEGVDPELLARSEQTRKIIPFARYARIAAACFAVLMLGGIGYVAVHVGGDFGHKAAMESANYSGNGAPASFADASVSGKGGANGKKSESADGKQKFDEAAAQEDFTEDNCMNEYLPEENAMNEQEATASENNKYCADGSYLDSYDTDGKQEAATQKNALSGITKEGSEGIMDELLAKLNIRVKQSTRQEDTAFSMKKMQMRVMIGEDARTLGQNELAGQIYEFLQNLELSPATEAEMPKGFAPEITITIWETDGNEASTYYLSGNYVKLEGDDTFYVIRNENYDFEELRDGLSLIVKE